MTGKASPVDVHVGSLVRKRRLMLGMSQDELAKTIGLSFQQIQKYEKGANRLGPARLQQIANTLQVSVSFFFDNAPGQRKSDGNAPSPDYITEFISSAECLALTKAFMRIKKLELRRSIVKAVEAIADEI